MLVDVILMQYDTSPDRYGILELVLQGEPTLVLSVNEQKHFPTRNTIDEQARKCGIGLFTHVDHPTDVPTSRYIERRSELMGQLQSDLFDVLDRKAAERKQRLQTQGRPPGVYIKAALTSHCTAYAARDEAIEEEARRIDYEEGHDFGFPTTEVYEKAERIVDDRLAFQKKAIRQLLGEAHDYTASRKANMEGKTESFRTKIGYRETTVTYSLKKGALYCKI